MWWDDKAEYLLHLRVIFYPRTESFYLSFGAIVSMELYRINNKIILKYDYFL